MKDNVAPGVLAMLTGDTFANLNFGNMKSVDPSTCSPAP